MAGFTTVELTDLEWQRQAPNLDPASFLLTADGSNRLDPHGQTVVFVMEGFWAQQDLVGLLREEPRWTSGLLRRWQQLHFTNLKRFSRFGAPTTERLGLVEVCKVVDASYHKRLLPSATSTSQRERPATANTAAGSTQTTHHLSTPLVTLQHRTNEAAASREAVQQNIWASRLAPPADAPSPPADAIPEDPPAEASAPPPLNSDSDAEEGVNVDVNVKAPRGIFFVRLTLQRAGFNSYAQLPVTTTVDYFIDSGSGEWLIPKSKYDASLKLNWRRGKRFKMWWEAPDTPGVGTWWTGTVQGRVQRDRRDPRRASPWEALRVKWDSGDQESCVSMWEIEKDDGQWLTLPDEVEPLSEDGGWEADWRSDQGEADAGDSSDVSSQRRPRRQRRRRRVVLPGEVEREQHLRNPKRRQNSSRLQSSSAGLDDDMHLSAEAWSAESDFLEPPAEDCLEDSTAGPLAASASPASIDFSARPPAGLSGAPSLPPRPQQRGPLLPARRKPLAKPVQASGQQHPQGHTSLAQQPQVAQQALQQQHPQVHSLRASEPEVPQQVPVAELLGAQQALAAAAAASTSAQQMPRLAPSASAGPSNAPTGLRQQPMQASSLQSNSPAQALGSALIAAAHAAAPAAGPLQPQQLLAPARLSAMQAIAQNPALQAISAQPDKALSEQLLRTLVDQAFGQILPNGQPTAQACLAWQLQPQWQPAPHAWPDAQLQAQGQPAAQVRPTGQLSAQRQLPQHLQPVSQTQFPAEAQAAAMAAAQARAAVHARLIARAQPPGEAGLRRQPMRIHPPPVRKPPKEKKILSPAEQLRGRRPAVELAAAGAAEQQNALAASQQLISLPTHRTIKSASKKKMEWNCMFCSRCGESGDVIGCDGTCLRSFHRDCLKEEELPDEDAPADCKWYCPECVVGKGVCSICRELGVVQRDIFKCRMGSCGHYLHYKCLKAIEAAGQYLKIFKEVSNAARTCIAELHYTCPSHFCQVCHVSGDAMKMMRCWRCPQAYHSRCQPKAARKLSSKNIECEACGLVRAGRDQAMAMVFPADTSEDMLDAQSLPVPQTSPPGPPQMPLSAAHQVSPVISMTPPPAVQSSPLGPRGWTPLVAYTPGVPGTEPHAESLLLSDDDSAHSQQEEDSLSPSHPAFKSYSPADTARQKVPAVAAAAVTYEEQIQAMESAWNNHAADANEAGAPDEQQQNADDESADVKPEEEQSEDDGMEDMSSRETSVSLPSDFNFGSENDSDVAPPQLKKKKPKQGRKSSSRPAKRALDASSPCTNAASDSSSESNLALPPKKKPEQKEKGTSASAKRTLRSAGAKRMLRSAGAKQSAKGVAQSNGGPAKSSAAL